MDTETLLIGAFVAIAVIGQLCLPLIGSYRRKRALRAAQARAALIEQAAEQMQREPDAHQQHQGLSGSNSERVL